MAFYGRHAEYEYKYYLSFRDLERVYVIQDLCVVFDFNLTFGSHCKEKKLTEQSMLGLIKRNLVF